MKVVIDAGHGNNTHGKRTPDDSMREYHFNSAVAELVIQGLSKYGVKTLKAHDDKRDVPLDERTDKANAWGADVYISIHANAASFGWSDANGIETYIYARGGKTEQIGKAIHSELVKLTGRRDRGLKTQNFHVLRETKMSAVLVECGFMTNKEEAELLKSEEYRKKCAQAIINGLVSHFKLKEVNICQTCKRPL